jgi:hypothetical protein
MMKTKTYSTGKINCRTYCKPVGNGWETGFVFNGRPLFVGNFIHQREANTWYGIMNREISRFAKKYTVGTHFPVTWFTSFVRNHLYRTYYQFLDRIFTRYNRTYNTAVIRDIRKYQRLRKSWTSQKKTPFYKAA